MCTNVNSINDPFEGIKKEDNNMKRKVCILIWTLTAVAIALLVLFATAKAQSTDLPKPEITWQGSVWPGEVVTVTVDLADEAFSAFVGTSVGVNPAPGCERVPHSYGMNCVEASTSFTVEIPSGARELWIYARAYFLEGESQEDIHLEIHGPSVGPAPQDPELPNLSVNVQPQDGLNITLGQFAIISTTVTNAGAGMDPETDIVVTAFTVNGFEFGARGVVPGMAKGESGTYYFHTTTSLKDVLPVGTHEFCAIVDPDNTVDESNEDNNVSCITINVTYPLYLPVLIR